MAAHKVFLGPLLPSYNNGIPQIIVTDTYVVLDNNNNVVPDPNGNITTGVTVPFAYNDGQLVIKSRVLKAIRDLYADQTIQAVYVNDLSGILNIL